MVQTGKSNDRYTATITLTTYERVQRSPAASTTIIIIVIRVLTVVVAVNHNISYGNDHEHRIEVPIDVYSIVGKMDNERVIINFLVVSSNRKIGFFGDHIVITTESVFYTSACNELSPKG